VIKINLINPFRAVPIKMRDAQPIGDPQIIPVQQQPETLIAEQPVILGKQLPEFHVTIIPE
jgi:hypothetical protein